MDPIVPILMLWLTQAAPELPVPKLPPVAVYSVPRSVIIKMTHGDNLSPQTGTCYMGIIYLDDRLDMDKIPDRSVLLHELVHYAQNYCAIPRDMAERAMVEDQAYAIQRKWLKEQGYKSEFNR